ncbi:hypothetical protein conserved [Leishmania donovani]|uniref:Hypothetical_protein_conserved n=1 Tax=Leishmania donovani TaxID=5661 RepID=A0A6J8F6V5_LEIDO|nr:hypothetical protein conserved [Leishmania donovani]VDZ43177.1 hypothetical_protein_conserved [Leishmania donovani]
MDELFDEKDCHRHPPLDLTSRAFQPKKYIQRVLANVSHAVFEGQLVDKVGVAEEDTGEALKQLIRDNLGVFINSKDAMDAVYNSDAELFTGEALEAITRSFKSASTSCESLVRPITATFLDVQKSRKSQDMLDKFFSVLGVPGAIYDSCGAKVAQRRQTATAMTAADGSTSSDDDDSASREGDADEARGLSGRDDQPKKEPHRATKRKASGDYDDDGLEEENEYEEDESDSDEKGTSAAADAAAKPHGTLEGPADSTAPADMYVLESGEEIYFWYGTPLVRLKDVDARRQHVDHVANYEAAVLHLRRAMLYLEETYSLIDGAMLTGDDGEPSKAMQASAATGDSRFPPAGQGTTSAATAGAVAGSSKNVSAAGRSVFAYKFAMALLRAALYLCSQLAEELIYANPADTVLIEDTLSMMMDTSIASVKLHHFCAVLQEVLGEGDRHEQVLTKLRTRLSSGGATAEGFSPKSGRTVSPPGVSDDSTVSFSPNRPVAEAGAGGAAAASASSVTAPRGGTTAYQHPVQFFISIVQRQQKHLFHSSAAGLLREASGWLWKAQTDAARGLEERHRQQEQRRKLSIAAAGGADAGEGTAAELLSGSDICGRRLSQNSYLGVSISGDGGFIGNANDSFLQECSFTQVNALVVGGRRQSSAGSPTSGDGDGDGDGVGVAASGSATVRSDGTPTEENRQAVGIIPDAYVSRLLDALNTPESPFPTSAEFRVGTLDMDAVLVSSCLQIRIHSSSLLNQLFTRAEVESAVMAQACSLNTFALRLCTECVGTLEHVVGSYWGGIATALHSGVFDFVPELDSPLHTILTQLLGNTAAQAAAGTGGVAAAGSGGGGLQRSPSTILSGTHSRSLSRVGEMDDNAHVSDGGVAVTGTANHGAPAADTRGRVAGAGVGPGSIEQLPRIRFVPTLPHVFHPAAADAANESATQQPTRPKRLRDISVQAVHDMISTAAATLQALFLAFINRSVVDGFVSALAQYRASDLRRYGRSERVELHAAVLYEVILSQWERMMNHVSDAMLRLKIVIGESSSSATITSEAQVEEVGDLLQELELLRSTCLRCYLHGIGVLSKAYLTALPLLQRNTDKSLDARVRSRLSRDSVSSHAVHKLLNVLSVVMDRCVPFFARDTEVYDSVDLFAVKSGSLRDDADEDAVAGERGGSDAGTRSAASRRRRLLRQRPENDPSGRGRCGDRSGTERHGRGSESCAPAALGDGTDAVVDPISELIAQFHRKLVMESLQDHEELVLALLSHLLLAFVDMLQLKCRTATTDVTLHPAERERCVVECMADTLCLATTLTPILTEHLLAPCFFELIARQLPELCATPVDVAAMLQSKQQQYSQVYLSVVEEHCQLAVDAMMNAYLALAQQPITDLVRRQGFVQPLFDWQRVSPHTTAAVRPYIADAIACIARAHETLNAIRQPVLGSAATQRLVAHLVRTFLTSFTSDVNVFELSVECSSSFLVYGLTLLEAEAATILSVVDAVVAHVKANPTTNELLPELAVTRENLVAVTKTLESYATSVGEAIVAARNSEGGGASEAVIALSLLSRGKRHERRDGMVQAAMRTLEYMLEAINTELEESSLSSAALLQLRSAAEKGDGAAGNGLRSAVAERIVQRIERRKEGYELRRARAAAAAEVERQRKKASVSAASPEDDSGPAGGSDSGAGRGGRRQPLRRRADGPQPAPTSAALGDDKDGDAESAEHLTPRTVQENERESLKAAEAASNVFRLAQDQRQKRRVRRVSKVDAADGRGADGGAEAGEVSAGTAESGPTPATVPPPLSVPLAGYAAGGKDDEGSEGAEAVPARHRVSRRARRRLVSGDNDGGVPERHERRANRFRRANVL